MMSRHLRATFSTDYLTLLRKSNTLLLILLHFKYVTLDFMYTVSIQGQPGSFHAVAAQQYFQDEIRLLPCDTFSETFQALATDKSNYALCAIENSLYGSINEVYDLLLNDKFTIIGEVYLRVEQCLIGLPGATVEDIKEVYSHPVALAQCEAFLEKKLPNAKRFEQHDTAGSVVSIRDWNNPNKAAIASAISAEMYAMHIIKRSIETNKENYTRFVILSKEISSDPHANKTSLVLKTDHSPGALYRALGSFAERQLNLSKLQSRPIIGKAWHYMFYLDIEHQSDAVMVEALNELKMKNTEVTLLGTYLAGEH
jgi:prephenate dehydratase